jgi:molecular chaperone DnaJ
MPPQREWLDTDYYGVLGVRKDAPADEIKKSYRALARSSHPDANPGDSNAEGRFKQIGTAYGVVGDAATRKEYDELRRLGAGGGGFAGGGFGGRPGAGGTGGGTGFEDIFGSMFNQGPSGPSRGGGRGARSRAGRDLEADVHMSFDDALAGVRTKLRINADAQCQTCIGSGARPGTTPARCRRCSGAGQVTVDQGPFSFAQPCPTCAGSGIEILEPCAVCSGKGTTVQARELTVRIPAGVKDGAVIRVPGRGGAGSAGGRPGDVLVRIHVEPDALFGRKGDDFTVEVPLSFAEAVLGTQLAVPLPEGGSKTIKVPAGTTHGRTFRVRAGGAPRRGGGNGDLLVTVLLDVPTKLSRRQKGIVEQLAELDDHSARERLLRHTGQTNERTE